MSCYNINNGGNMERVIIRKAILQDLTSIQELNDNLFELEFNNFDDTIKREWALEKDGKEYFEHMINNKIVFVAQIEEKIVGYLAGGICEQISYIKENFAELDNMCIDEKCRGFGIGTLLIQEFKNYCRDKHIQNIKVTASAKNNNAIQFYIKNGFEDYNVTLKLKI